MVNLRGKRTLDQWLYKVCEKIKLKFYRIKKGWGEKLNKKFYLKDDYDELDHMQFWIMQNCPDFNINSEQLEIEVTLKVVKDEELPVKIIINKLK